MCFHLAFYIVLFLTLIFMLMFDYCYLWILLVLI